MGKWKWLYDMVLTTWRLKVIIIVIRQMTDYWLCTQHCVCSCSIANTVHCTDKPCCRFSRDCILVPITSFSSLGYITFMEFENIKGLEQEQMREDKKNCCVYIKSYWNNDILRQKKIGGHWISRLMQIVAPIQYIFF